MRYKYKEFFLLLLLISPISYLSGQNYRTQSIAADIHSIEVTANGDWNSYPIINANSSDQVHISFDQVSEELSSQLRYKVLFCNADWTLNESVSEIEYLDGFNDNFIEDYNASLNTTVSYTHYKLRIPNNDVNIKLSGNYVVVVYDEEKGEDEILLNACFSILDKKADILASVSTTTDIDSNNKHHQLSFDVNYKMQLRDVKNDLKVFVRQNNRLDNERKNLVPNYIMPSKLRYVHNKALIFEACNEYYRFDISSHKSNGRNVAQIEYKRPNYYMYLVPNRIIKDGSYSYDQDQNGRVIYRTLNSDNVETEGDYLYTIFTLHADAPFQSDIYVNGAFTNNTFSEIYKMHYDNENREYYLQLLLKQGIYNYQYLVEKGKIFSTEGIGGNFYETENEYSIYIYYRPSGQKYDSLVGFTNIQSRAK